MSGIRTVLPIPSGRPAAAAPAPPLDGDPQRLALFLDVDGTLLDIADRPGDITVPGGLVALLARLSERLGGALALLSGRPLAELDRLFAPLRLPAGGLHGLQLRFPDGTIPPTSGGRDLATIRAEAMALAAAIPGVLVEDKAYTLALHFRLAPQAEAKVDAVARAWLERLGPAWCLQRGKAVVEIRPTGGDKGTALALLMRDAAFRGRRPLMIGDDLTDEHAFSTAMDLGGQGVHVGHRVDSVAPLRLPDPAAVRHWLQALAHRLHEEIP